MSDFIEPRLRFLEQLPPPASFGDNAVLLYDAILPKVNKAFGAWAKRFPAAYPVRAGEGLKDLKKFANHVEKFMKLTARMNPREMRLIVAGGGSVGDFGGFLANIYKRGVRLTHVPTTWLAAIDSSHGGKTALNVGGVKNQIGTFYPAEEILLLKPLLMSQPAARATEAFGELAKIAMIDGGPWVRKLENARETGGELLWKYLKPAIEAKYKVVRKDPKEMSGVRQVLNLGHTFGHVLEATKGWAHGQSVAQGLFFAIYWSYERKLLSESETFRALHLLEDKLGLLPMHDTAEYKRARLAKNVCRKLLLQDKKRAGKGLVTFIFLKKFGQVARESVHVDELIKEAQEQGWVR